LAFFDARSGALFENRSAIGRRGPRVFPKLLIETAEVVVADIVRNVDYRLTERKAVGSVRYAKMVKILAWRHFEVSSELS